MLEVLELGLSETKTANPAKPFIKWAGGKGQLLETFRAYYPRKIQEGNFQRYIEPFLGGGAVLFDVMQRFNIEEAYVFDVNIELVNTYNVIKNDINGILEILKELQYKYISANEKEKKEMYYLIREEYNNGLKNTTSNKIKMAGWFMFLNRTCFNGLFRVNKSGFFNVPSGDYKNPTICDQDNLVAVNKLLQKVKISVGDYKDSLKLCNENTFVYFDPPYRPLNPTSSFTSYSKSEFGDKQQKELGKFFNKCNKKNALLMLSNSDPKNENCDDNFFDNIYSEFNVHRVMAKRAINSNAGRRGLISEILVTNYKIFKE